MHNLFLVYFVNLYMFRPYLGPSSGGTTVCIQKLVLIFLFKWLSLVVVGLESNPTRTKDSHLKRIISTICCIHTVVPPDDGPRYGRNMYRLTKYTKNKLCIKLVFLYTTKIIFMFRNVIRFAPKYNPSSISAIFLGYIYKPTFHHSHSNRQHVRILRFPVYIYVIISERDNRRVCHSFSSLSYDRSNASSKASSPHSAIQNFLL